MNSLNSTEVMIGQNASRAKSFTRRSSSSLIHNYSNFKRTSCPGRFMRYENGSCVDYPKELTEELKLGFSEGKPAVEARVMGLNCLFDFYRMLEIDLDSGNQRSIAWIDVDGKCFLPKFFVNTYENDRQEEGSADCDENFSKVQIEIRIREDSGASEGAELDRNVRMCKRKREESVENGKMEGGSSGNNAKRQQLVGGESLSARWPKARILGTEERGYTIVKNLFLSGLEIVDPGATVTSVHQCIRTGILDKARYEVFAKQMEMTKRARGESNMVFAWYGTSATGVESTLTHGFGLPSNSARSVGHGIGIHLSPVRSPQNSAILSEMDDNGEKHVILCRVILGKCEKVEAGSQQLYPSSVEYDTGVDDLNNPRWYTVWHANMNTHILPDCVVSYRPVNISGSMKSSRNWAPPPSTFVAKLLSKLIRSSIPLPRFQELQMLCVSFKEGKLAKDAFMKQVRAVVGDDVLRLTIQEICG